MGRRCHCSEAAFGGTGHTQPAFPALRTRAGAGLVRGGFLARAEQALDAERGRWFLWLPVFFGCGIALYLGAPVEPPILLAVGATLLALALRMFFRATAFRLILGSTILVVALGFLTAKVCTRCSWKRRRSPASTVSPNWRAGWSALSRRKSASG